MRHAGIDVDGFASQIDIDELGLEDAGLHFDSNDNGGYPDFLYEKTKIKQTKLEESLAKLNKNSIITSGSLNSLAIKLNSLKSNRDDNYD